MTSQPVKCPGCFQDIAGWPDRCPLCGESLGKQPAADSTRQATQEAGSSSSGASMTGVADTTARQGNTAHTVFPADDSFSGAVVAAIRQCLQVRGRLAKAPYQKVLAVVALLWIVGFPLLNMMLGDSDSAGTCLMTLSFPLITATIRRLHDTGRSARWMWLAFTGFGVPLLLVLACQPSQAGPNRFGPFGPG